VLAVFSRFFIERPIFATVISLVITLAGGVALTRLPLAQYPEIAPPTVQVDCNYPGASALVVAESIAAPIEQQVNGVEGMLYMSSQCTNDGSYSLTVTFEPGINLDMAQVLVQNRVNLATPALPDVVKATAVTTRKRSSEILLTIALNSPDGRYNQLYLSNYAFTRLKDELYRLPGISDVTIFGQRDYSMRIWVDPDRLADLKLTALDVVNAIRAQNDQIAAGQLAQPPVASARQPIQVTLSAKGRLTEPEEFGNIVLKAFPDGRLVRLKHVARVELGAKSEDVSNSFDGKPTIGLAIFTLPDSNALDTADAVFAKMTELSKEFPAGIEYEIGYDTTPFIKESIEEVVKTLRDAILLVALVVVIFLQTWRSALIPLAAVPVAIIGTFAAMALAGFSINNLTLFGLVLAVGIVVDDAIVVVEAVEYQIERGLAPREAALAAMEQVSGPVVAVGLVLAAVFVPCAFLSGIVGQFFRQFALTIAISTLISMFNSLTLSPALCALLLRGKHTRRDPVTWLVDTLLGWFFRLFNRVFGFSGRLHGKAVGMLLRVPLFVLVVYGGLIGLTIWGFGRLPIGFIPTQDKGYLIASIELPDAASANRTRAVIEKISRIALDTQGVKHCNGVAGNAFVLGAYGSNLGSMFIILDNFSERRQPGLHADDIMASLKKKFAAQVPEAKINVFGAPAVPRLGRAGGIKFMIEDRGDTSLAELQKVTEDFIDKANEQPGLEGLFTVFRVNSPQLYADVDRKAALSQGVELGDIFGTMQATLGQRYVNDFNLLGRTWQVNVQADTRFRNEASDMKRLKVRNAMGQMVPIATLADMRQIGGPLVVTRYNMYPAAAVNGNIKTGVSSGDAITVLEKLAARELPASMHFEWTELTFIEKTSRNTGLLIFGLSSAFVFLVLAALYESWALPLAVILVVPLCVLCSIGGVWVADQDINIFTQVGFVVLIGLACKNAILIVEFAKLKHEAGASRRDAVLAACRLRYRPILMTSVAFLLGVTPLLFATGAGAEMRKALGVAVFSGMLGVTFFGLLFTPVFFAVVDRVAHGRWSASERLQRFSDAVMYAVSLRFLRDGLKRALGRSRI